MILLAIKIKRFGVRYKGIRYGPGLPGGSILYGLSEEEEDRLIAASNGTIEKYAEEEKIMPEEEKNICESLEGQNITQKSKGRKKKAVD